MCKKMIFLICAVSLLTLAGSASADPDLLAYWTFDNSGDLGHDDSGNGRDLAVHGAAAYTAGGKINGAMSLPGQNTAYLEDDDGGNYINGLDAITVAGWIKSEEINSDRGFFTTRDPAGPDGKQCLGIRHDASGDSENNIIKFYVMTTQDKGLYESPGDVQTTEWQHVVITWSAAGGRSELYLDGELQELSRRETESGAGEPLGGTLDNAAMVRLGVGYKNLGWLGLVDDVRIYERALSGSEVLQLFSADIAWNPSPHHLAENVCPDVVLSWSPGESAASHDVYFGTGLSDVNESATAVKQAHDTNSYPVSVELGETYYWRIDEVNGVDRCTGKIWKFTTNDGNAFGPYPADGQSKVAIEPTLRWTPGCSATSHDVYFGTSWEQVSSMTDPCATKALGDESYSPDTLDYLSWYYWRIDEVDGGNTWRGQIWSFRSRSAIIDPNLLVWYRFDEIHPTGGIGHDYSGHKAHIGVGSGNWDPNDGFEGGSLLCDNNFGSQIPSQVLNPISSAITVAAWVNGLADQRSNRDHPIFDGGDQSGGLRDGEFKLTALVPSQEPDLDVCWRAGNDTNDVLVWEEATAEAWKDNWHHFAFVKDESAGVMSIYFDGFIVDSSTGVDSTLTNVKGKEFKIGAYTDHDDDYEGKLDDFRVYDYALSDTEIAALYRGGDIGLAWAPHPYDGEVDVGRDVVLSWRPGDYAAYHDVYFGTDSDDVDSADSSLPVGGSVYKGRQDLDANTYSPGSLELGAIYYWRIDEVNEPNLWRGNIWRFTVADFITVDDMESYNQTDNWISDTWIDGFGNWSGSEVYVGIEPTNPAYGGEQSMMYEYYNDGGYFGDLDYYSEIEHQFTAAQDWTEADVKILTLFFYGDPNNDANERMYAGLEDTRGTGSYAQVDYGCYEDESMDDVREAEWHQWDIGLSDFTGVIRMDVNKVYIGFGIRGNPNPGGTVGGNGVVYFDDIRLYPPKCVPRRLKPAADFTDDCMVDLADVGEIAKRWLRTDIIFDEYTEPSDANLVGWWKLDEGLGAIANDSSPSGNHNGTINGDASWVAGRIGPYALQFDGGKVLVPDAVELRPESVVSATAWIYDTQEPGDSARMIVKGKNDRETYCLEAGNADNASFYVGDVNGDRYFAKSKEGDFYPDDWIHLAGTYDGCIVKFYIDGQVVGTEEANSIELSQDPCGLAIGNKADANDRPFSGTIDDVRVYNRALADAEIAWLASDGTGFIPLVLEENLYKEDERQVINFRDIDVLLDNWLEQILWPQ